jgi:hypothetical protein
LSQHSTSLYRYIHIDHILFLLTDTSLDNIPEVVPLASSKLLIYQRRIGAPRPRTSITIIEDGAASSAGLLRALQRHIVCLLLCDGISQSRTNHVNFSIGLALADTLDDLISSRRIEPQLAMRIMANFDQHIASVLGEKVKARMNFKVSGTFTASKGQLACDSGDMLTFHSCRATSMSTDFVTRSGLL